MTFYSSYRVLQCHSSRWMILLCTDSQNLVVLYWYINMEELLIAIVRMGVDVEHWNQRYYNSQGSILGPLPAEHGCLLNVSVAYNITHYMLLTSNNNATRHRERIKRQAENKHKHYQRENDSAASPTTLRDCIQVLKDAKDEFMGTVSSPRRYIENIVHEFVKTLPCEPEDSMRFTPQLAWGWIP
ncbi:hypothetical protein P692DRAFT_20818539 [Suillus brevipes Sb2]|nr:hypothetical protein P692DRAFT_20818539 [Suillus brevipes Sb2]